MRAPKSIIAALVVATAAAAAVLAVAPSAGAHGYISSPPSRQALCASGAVPSCGDLVYEPQSVEAPKGSRLCSGGSRFPVLDDESRAWPATQVGGSVDFEWRLTAAHRTGTWDYYVDGHQIASFDEGGAQPASTVRHRVDLAGHPGRITVLAVWNIADTGNAFYNCVDLVVDGAGAGGSGAGGRAPEQPRPMPEQPRLTPEQPAQTHDHRTTYPIPTQPGTAQRSTTQLSTAQPSTAQPSTAQPSTAQPSTAQPSAVQPDPGRRHEGEPAAGRGTWAPQTAYQVGDVVEWEGRRFSCRQAHTSLPGWEPRIWTLALWLPLD